MPFNMRARLILAGLLIAGCAAFRVPLEADPVTHMLVQMPALAWAGWLIAGTLISAVPARRLPDLNGGGFAGLLIVIFSIAFWMLPRSIDGALASPAMETAKFLSVPLLIGAPLRWSWYRAHPLLRGVLLCNSLSMLGVLAWLYTGAPLRVCNSYLVDDQKRLGIAFLCVALGLAIWWGGRLFLNPTRSENTVRVWPVRGNRAV